MQTNALIVYGHVKSGKGKLWIWLDFH